MCGIASFINGCSFFYYLLLLVALLCQFSLPPGGSYLFGVYLRTISGWSKGTFTKDVFILGVIEHGGIFIMVRNPFSVGGDLISLLGTFAL